MSNPVVGIIMGSDSDLDVMSEAAKVFDEFGVAYETRVISAHRTPKEMGDYAAGAAERGLQVIIAGAGGSAHLPGMVASETTLPVIGIPVKRDHHGHEAFWSSVKMPPGIPLATMPENGAKNGALLALRIIALSDAAVAKQYADYVQKMHDAVLDTDARLQTEGWQAMIGQ